MVFAAVSISNLTASQSSQRTGGYKNQVYMYVHAEIVCGHNSRAVNYKELIIPKPWMLTVTTTLYYSHTLYIIVSLYYVYLSRGLHSPNFVYSWVRISWTDAHVLHPNSGLINTLTMHYFVSAAQTLCLIFALNNIHYSMLSRHLPHCGHGTDLNYWKSHS